MSELVVNVYPPSNDPLSVVLNPQGFNVYITGDQTIDGVKSFLLRPTVSGTGVMLSGEAAQLPDTLVYTTGDQKIYGQKDFQDVMAIDGVATFSCSPAAAEFDVRPLINGTGVMLSGEAAQLPITLVYTTGDQTISGAKTFDVRPDVNGLPVALTSDLPTVPDVPDLGELFMALTMDTGGAPVNYNALPPSGAPDGQSWIDPETGRVYVKIGGAWVDTATNAWPHAVDYFVNTTGDQTIGGEKIFTTRPTVSGVGVLLSGEITTFITLLATGVDYANISFPYTFNVAPCVVTTLEATGTLYSHSISNITTSGFRADFSDDILYTGTKLHTIVGNL